MSMFVFMTIAVNFERPPRMFATRAEMNPSVSLLRRSPLNITRAVIPLVSLVSNPRSRYHLICWFLPLLPEWFWVIRAERNCRGGFQVLVLMSAVTDRVSGRIRARRFPEVECSLRSVCEKMASAMIRRCSHRSPSFRYQLHLSGAERRWNRFKNI